MFCPKCGNADTKVVDSRVIEDWQSIRRRRQCEYCKTRFTTFERRWFTELMVIKKDSTKELYDRSKLKRAIMLASAKRNIDTDTIENMIATLESQWSSENQEISSQRIGDDILNMLKDIDTVAYIRFASVYKDFDSLENFQDIINRW